MLRSMFALGSLVAVAACATVRDGEPIAWHKDAALKRLTAERLEKFDSEKQFVDYLKRVHALAEARGEWWAGAPLQYASLDQPPPPCDPSLQECPDEKDSSPVVVTANKRDSVQDSAVAVTVTSASVGEPTITNVQKAGVDEGDIVKKIGKHLVLLQDGRLFSVDMDTLTMSDRENVYTDPRDDSWYDEILVTGRRVLVTGYSYDENATRLSVFAMDEKGRFTPEGTFFLSSNDYYDGSNYATRLVGDKLVIYSPMDLTEVEPGKAVQYPLVRRWRDSPATTTAEAKQLFDARDIYKPVQPTLEPGVHTVSVCDLGSEAMKKDLACKTTAFVAPLNRVYYVSPDDVFVWVSGSRDLWTETCHAGPQLEFNDGSPSSVFRIPLSGARPTVMHVRGTPSDQFAMDTSTGEFRALVYWGMTMCDERDESAASMQLKYFSASMGMFRDDIRTAPQARYRDAPGFGPGVSHYETRFTDDHVVYGARESWWSGAPAKNENPRTSQLVALPVNQTSNALVMGVGHDINRVERIGADIVVTGYHDWQGLSVSMVDLNDTPRIADTLTLKGRYESEGRSHAFNARLDPDGGGLMGIPTVAFTEESYRWWWRSDESDVSFMSFDAINDIEEAGELKPSPNSVDPAYRCEVSCIDWYGNSRPIFIRDRIYALTGTEIIEGRLAEGKVVEVRRLNLTTSLN
jgi:Beta propeller domain